MGSEGDGLGVVGSEGVGLGVVGSEGAGLEGGSTVKRFSVCVCIYMGVFVYM